MKKIFAVMLVITMVLAFTACSGNKGDSPTVVVGNYFTAFAQGDLDTAAEFTTNPEQNSAVKILGGIEDDYKEIILTVFKTLECAVAEETIDGNIATVTATISRVDANAILADSGSASLDEYLSGNVSGEDHEANFVTYVKEALNAPNAPVAVDSINIRLVKDTDDQWKIDVGAEMSSLFSFTF